MKAKLTFGKLSFEWETPENDVGVVLRQILSAYPDREPVPATVPELKPIEVPEPESEEEPEAPIEEEHEPEPEEEPEAGDTIPPEPKEREPLGKAIERLQKEKKMRGGRKNCKALVLKKDGETKWFETQLEAAIFLEVTEGTISKAINNSSKVKGWRIERDNPKTIL